MDIVAADTAAPPAASVPQTKFLRLASHCGDAWSVVADSSAAWSWLQELACGSDMNPSSKKKRAPGKISGKTEERGVPGRRSGFPIATSAPPALAPQVKSRDWFFRAANSEPERHLEKVGRTSLSYPEKRMQAICTRI